MELDDLKQSWNKQTIQSNKNTNIMELIHHKSYGPIAALKRNFRKQMLVMILMPVFLFITNRSNAIGSIMFWFYVFFCLAVVVFFYFNYRIATRMESMDDNVKANIEKQTLLLEKRMQWKMVGLRIALVFFMLLTEVVPYFQHYRMLDKWHSLSPFIRVGAYLLFLVLQYFASRRVSERKFGAHLKRLKELVKEIGE